MTKFLQPTHGTITLLGEESPGPRPTRSPAWSGTLVSDLGGVPTPDLLDNVRVAPATAESPATQFWKSLSSLDTLNGKAEQLIRSVGLDREANALAADLSYGRKRRTRNRQTLALEPKVLLLDEPMAGMGHEDVGWSPRSFAQWRASAQC
ncbi:ATP-binding cassette domain-containing protein [Sinorhizobium meliloti]|nr:ATP-binding cassette domain-containing protein [Sinorhizobium meliloti]